jgi:hypothetical protein
MEDERRVLDRDRYEAPALRELGTMEELTSGEDGSILDTTTTT